MIDKLTVIKETEDFIVCIKPAGVSSQKSDSENMPELLKNRLSLPLEPLTLHRIDTGVSGVTVYGKTKAFASDFSKQLENGDFKKEYYAVVHSVPQNPSGIYEDLLFKDSKKNKSYVVKRERKGVKKASLEYETVNTVKHNNEIFSLVKIHLNTGRTHQIRVQFSSRKMPLAGDGKYGGSDNCNIALLLKSISFNYKNEKLHFEIPFPEMFPWNLF